MDDDLVGQDGLGAGLQLHQVVFAHVDSVFQLLALEGKREQIVKVLANPVGRFNAQLNDVMSSN